MTPISEEEVLQRLKSITNGPWAKSVGSIRRTLARQSKIDVRDLKSYPIYLDRIKLTAKDKRNDERLAKTLRSHFNSPVHGKAEIKIRENLDMALLVPQLFELAVQTGYLNEEHVKGPSREFLVDLFWSESARQFVAAYDYLSIPMLAARVGVVGFEDVQPPQPNPNAQFRFAAFLAHLRAFYSNDKIDTWIGFLDDYIQERNEQKKFWDYLNRNRASWPVRAPDLMEGCEEFVSSLASIFELLDEEETASYGLIHAYWLQKFFGYSKNERGFEKDPVWDKNDSWARTFSNSPRLIDQQIDHEIATLLRDQFQKKVGVLRRTFDVVTNMVTSHVQQQNSTQTQFRV